MCAWKVKLIGDPAIDVYERYGHILDKENDVPGVPSEERTHWEQSRIRRPSESPGGALLLHKFLSLASPDNISSPQLGHWLGGRENGIYASEEAKNCLRAYFRMEKIKKFPPDEGCRNTTYQYRIEEGGFEGTTPSTTKRINRPIYDATFTVSKNNDQKEKGLLNLIIDNGDGLRAQIDNFLTALSATTGASPNESLPTLTIVKTTYPFRGSARDFYGKLVDALGTENLLVVINTGDLRRAGWPISRGVSWEQTTTDILDAVREVFMSDQQPLMFQHLLVRISIEGALYIHRRTGSARPWTDCRLIFDPQSIGGDFNERTVGWVQGASTVLTCSIAAALLTNPAGPDVRVSDILKSRERERERKGEGPEAATATPPIVKGILNGIRDAQRHFRRGYLLHTKDEDKEAGPDNLDHSNPFAETEYKLAESVDQKNEDEKLWQRLSIFAACPETIPRQASCFIGQGKVPTDGTPFDIINFVKTGAPPRDVPMAKLGDLITFDRTEIESYRSVRKVLTNFLRRGRSQTRLIESKPISIAVFGQPGSGKSFGVEQVAKSMFRDSREWDWMEFNLSEFESPCDLAKAFHSVRDTVLTGRTPVAFFDEFDCTRESQHLGWLKYFLAPMQSGKFKEGEQLHPIGGAIFVFAGGTCHTFSQFSDDSQNADKVAKKPDFISRLSGHIDVLGPNGRKQIDGACMLRRATLLRSLLRKHAAKFDHNGTLRIDNSVVHAFLRASEYRHGARSMESIIRMSNLSGLKKFTAGAIPERDQLEMHVGANNFFDLLKEARTSN